MNTSSTFTDLKEENINNQQKNIDMFEEFDSIKESCLEKAPTHMITYYVKHGKSISYPVICENDEDVLLAAVEKINQHSQYDWLEVCKRVDDGSMKTAYEVRYGHTKKIKVTAYMI